MYDYVRYCIRRINCLSSYPKAYKQVNQTVVPWTKQSVFEWRWTWLKYHSFVANSSVCLCACACVRACACVCVNTTPINTMSWIFNDIKAILLKEELSPLPNSDNSRKQNCVRNLGKLQAELLPLHSILLVKGDHCVGDWQLPTRNRIQYQGYRWWTE